MSKSKIIIAVDGYSSCGKSTLARQIAQQLHYNYIDTGAMYRAVTLFALKNELIVDNNVLENQLISALPSINISFKFNMLRNASDTMLNDENIEDEIRQLTVSNFVSPVATIKEVREAMVIQQQAYGTEKGIVMDGRDIGTVVFPNAELKLFMTASPEIRAKRRYDELIEKGENITYNEILENVKQRDYIDENREESPLRKASDAIIIDNSMLTRDEQFALVMSYVDQLIAKL